MTRFRTTITIAALALTAMLPAQAMAFESGDTSNWYDADTEGVMAGPFNGYTGLEFTADEVVINGSSGIIDVGDLPGGVAPSGEDGFYLDDFQSFRTLAP